MPVQSSRAHRAAAQTPARDGAQRAAADAAPGDTAARGSAPGNDADCTVGSTVHAGSDAPDAPPAATPQRGHARRRPAAARPASPERRRRSRRDALLFFALIGPNLLAILVFSYYPSLYNIGLSLTSWDFVAPSPEFVGLDNYRELFADPDFLRVLMNTLLFTGISVFGSIIGGILLGSLLATKVPLTGFAQTMAFAPHMLPGAAVGTLWLFMFDPNYGLSRWLFAQFGAVSPEWTTTSDWSLWAITLAYTWQRLGFVTVICYTAILDLPRDLYEAAALDGAHGWQLMRHITLPLLSPIVFFLSITGVISAAQTFDIISVMTNGGPGISSSTLSWFVYEEAFQKFDIGTASAAATVLLVLLLLLTFVQVRIGEKKVNYDS